MTHSYGGQGPMLLGIGIGQALLGTILVGLRVWDARTKVSKVKWTLSWAVLAWLVGVIEIFFYAAAVHHGAGNHISALNYHDLVNVLKYSYIGFAVGVAGLAISKFAVIALLLGVATPQQNKRRALLWTIATVIGVIGVIQIALILTQCKPLPKLWDVVRPGTCAGKDATLNFSIFHGSLSAAADLAIALYPISIVWNLQASIRVKIGFCALMAGGIICAVAAALRSYYTHALLNPTDPTYALGTYLVWAITEVWVAIILGSIPPLRPLFLRWFRGIQSSGGKGTTGGRATGMSGTGLSEKRGTMVGKNTINIMATLRDDVSEEDGRVPSPGGKMTGITVSHGVVVHVDGDDVV